MANGKSIPSHDLFYIYNYNINKMNGTWNNEMGFGLVDAYAAVRRALGYKEIVSPYFSYV